MTAAATLANEHGIDDLISFGKYINKTVRQVCVLNPGYLLWAHNTIHWFKLDKDSLRIAKAKDEQRSHERRSTVKQQRRKFVPYETNDFDDYDSEYMRADDWSPSSFF